MRILPRFQRETVEQAQKVARIVIEAGGQKPDEDPTHQASSTDLRGIPVQARGVGGTIRETDPLAAAIDNEHRRSRRAKYA